MVTVWANPDVGGGSFFIMLSLNDRQPLPQDLQVKVGIQPVSGRPPEEVFNAWREKLKGQVEYKVVLAFDREERWHIHLMLSNVTGVK